MSFTRLDPTDFVVSIDSITAPAWSTGNPTLSQFYVASPVVTSNISQGAFYLNVYQLPVVTAGSAVQFSIAYGHAQGSGSKYYNPLVPGVTPTLTTYKQYRTLVYGTALTASNQGFNFGGQNTNSTDIFVINVDRNRYRESLFPGTFNLTLAGPAGTVQLTDNSNQTTVVNYLDCGRVYDIVSGSNGYAATTTVPNQTANGYTASGSYGLFLPDIGAIILNPRALAGTLINGGIGLVIDTTANANTPYTNVNNTTLFNAISNGASFQLNSQESVASDYVFVRVRNSDYNYSTNPTFISGSGDLAYATLINNPQTYITTVGLYNNNNELLAVAKMSRPLVKDFTKEALLRVKLDW